MIGAIIGGIVAGWAAGKLINGKGFGCWWDLVIGLIGGVVGGLILDRRNDNGYHRSVAARLDSTSREEIIRTFSHYKKGLLFLRSATKERSFFSTLPIIPKRAFDDLMT